MFWTSWLRNYKDREIFRREMKSLRRTVEDFNESKWEKTHAELLPQFQKKKRKIGETSNVENKKQSKDQKLHNEQTHFNQVERKQLVSNIFELLKEQTLEQQLDVLLSCINDERLQRLPRRKKMKTEGKVLNSLLQMIQVIPRYRNEEMLHAKDVLVASLCGTMGTENEVHFYEFQNCFQVYIRKKKNM